MTDKAKGMVLASFAADSLALGAHWIYDVESIDRQFGRIERFLTPQENSYHQTKSMGEFTHYGDQTLCLLESVSAKSGFELNNFADRWKHLFEDYQGYVDQATKATLRNFESDQDPAEAGSTSHDLGGASRISPLVYVYYQDVDMLTTYAKAQTAMTHNNPLVVEAAGFFAALTSDVLNGSSPSKALDEIIRNGSVQPPLTDWITEGQRSATLETRQVILNFGQMCDIAAAFPSVIHLILKYDTDLKTALVENVMAGGDSAARGLVVGMVLGAYQGLDAIPSDWLVNLKPYQHIVGLLDSLDKQ
jgi:ADP-ribosylglycohydrolase